MRRYGAAARDTSIALRRCALNSRHDKPHPPFRSRRPLRPRHHAGFRASLSGAPDLAAGAVGAGRLDRHPGAHRRAPSAPVDGPAGHHREPHRRGRQYRHRRGRTRGARRLHDPVQHDERAHHEPRALRHHAVRWREGFLPDHAARLRDQHDGGSSFGAGQHGAGVHRLRESQSRQDRLRVVGARLDQSSVRRDAGEDGRHRDAARAVSRRRARRRRYGRRAVPAFLHRRHAEPAPRARRASSSCSPSPRRSARRSCPTCRPSPRPCRATR